MCPSWPAALAMGKSTVHRLCATLAAGGLLDHNAETGRYRLGLRLYELGTLVSAHMDLHDAAGPALLEVRNRTGETVQLAVLDGREVVYVERLESSHTVRLFGRVGHRNSAHCTATGKVLLAHLPDAELDALLDGWVLESRHALHDHRPRRPAESAGRGPPPGLGQEHQRGRDRRGLGGRPGAGRHRGGGGRPVGGRPGHAARRRVAAALRRNGHGGGRRHLPPARILGAPPAPGRRPGDDSTPQGTADAALQGRPNPHAHSAPHRSPTPT